MGFIKTSGGSFGGHVYDMYGNEIIGGAGTPNADTITEGAINKFYTEERVEDHVNLILKVGTNMTKEYNETTGEIMINAVVPPVEPQQNPFLVGVLSDVLSPSYYYYGGEDGAGDWRVYRILASNRNIREFATGNTNNGVQTLGSAWQQRHSLAYF